MEKKIRFCIRISPDLKTAFKSAAALAGSTLETVTTDSLRFYAGDTDKPLLHRRERFLVALKIAKETQNQLSPKSEG